jgi:hypothetical protein
VYGVDAVSSYGSAIAGRMRHHMRVFKLDSLFAMNAANEIVNKRFVLRDLLTTGGPASVKEYLEGELASYESADKNSWQTAMYRAAVASNWFCSGGFAHN